MRSVSKPSELSVLKIADRVRRSMRPSATDTEVLDLCRRECMSEIIEGIPARKLDPRSVFASISKTERLVFCTLRCELEILQDLADDPSVKEIMVNGPDAVFVERGRGIEKTDIRFETPRQLEQVIQRLAAGVGREMNDLNPIVDARLSDGSRFNAVASNIAVGGPILTIRKFNKSSMTMDDLVEQGDISRDAADLLIKLVQARYNIFICGGTSSGKTTFLNVLSDHIPPEERVVVIEDSAELQIRGHEDLVRMEAKAPNAQGKGGVTIRDLIKTSLRMRPDRIIVGEVRGAETVQMIAAMSSGHDGSLSTGHSNSARGMLARLETMFLSGQDFPLEAVRGQIAQAIDVFVHLARTSDGHRRVMEISEVAGFEDGQIELSQIYSYVPGEGLKPTGKKLRNTEKLRLRGFVD